MDKTSVFWIVLGLILCLCLFAVILFLIRRSKSKRKVCGMTMDEKQHLLNEVAEPFGFAYAGEEDVFTGRLDAWQRKSGYEALFDKAAAHFHMIFDDPVRIQRHPLMCRKFSLLFPVVSL